MSIFCSRVILLTMALTFCSSSGVEGDGAWAKQLAANRMNAEIRRASLLIAAPLCVDEKRVTKNPLLYARGQNLICLCETRQHFYNRRPIKAIRNNDVH